MGRVIRGLRDREGVHAREEPLEVGELLERLGELRAQLRALEERIHRLLPLKDILDAPGRRAQPRAQRASAEARGALVDDREERTSRGAVGRVLEDFEVLKRLGVEHKRCRAALVASPGADRVSVSVRGHPRRHVAHREQLTVQQQALQVRRAPTKGREREARRAIRRLAERSRPARLGARHLRLVLFLVIVRGGGGAGGGTDRGLVKILARLERLGAGRLVGPKGRARQRVEEPVRHGAPEQRVRFAGERLLVDDDLIRPELREERAQAAVLLIVNDLPEVEVAGRRVHERHAQRAARDVLIHRK